MDSVRRASVGAAALLLLVAALGTSAIAATTGQPSSERARPVRGLTDERRGDETAQGRRRTPAEPKGNPASLAGMRAGRLSCGDVITQSTTLTADVGPCSGNGIIIGADNIMLNLNGHSVSGTPGPGDGSAAGIRLPNRRGVRVTGHPGNSGKKGTVTGFDAGVAINAGSGNTVENMDVHDNIGPNGDAGEPELGDGIVAFRSSNNQILNNQVTNNGLYDGIGILGIGSNGNTIQGNVVENSVGIFDDRTFVGTGIIVNTFLDLADRRRGESIYENKVIGNTVRGNNGSGVSNISNVRGQVVGNRVEDNGSSFYGNIDALSTGLAATGIGIQAGQRAQQDTHMVVANNDVVHNGLDGIYIRTHENRVEANRVTGNGIAGIHIFVGERNEVFRNVATSNNILDLLDESGYEDGNFDCDANNWLGNTWGPLSPVGADFGFATSYFPDCTTVGGTGPNPPVTS